MDETRHAFASFSLPFCVYGLRNLFIDVIGKMHQFMRFIYYILSFIVHSVLVSLILFVRSSSHENCSRLCSWMSVLDRHGCGYFDEYNSWIKAETIFYLLDSCIYIFFLISFRWNLLSMRAISDGQSIQNVFRNAYELRTHPQWNYFETKIKISFFAFLFWRDRWVFE